MDQTFLATLFSKSIIAIVASVAVSIYIRIFQIANVKRHRPNAIESRIDFLANRQLFTTKYHIIAKISLPIGALLTITELWILSRRADIFDMKLFPDYILCILIFLLLIAYILFSFLDNQLAVKKSGIYCKYGFSDAIIKLSELSSISTNEKGTLNIRMKNGNEIILKGLKKTDEAINCLKHLIESDMEK